MGLFRRNKRSLSADSSTRTPYNQSDNMPLNPKEDVDICITCLTKSAPKLPLREELPSLGVELIYKARGTGAKVSKHEAHQAAKNFRYKESYKDLAKRRLFPKSSRRIRGILEERRLRESEIKHISSAVSYESYQNELYGDWVTDTSSSAQSKHSSSSSSASSVSEIKTKENRRMTKTALKRWRLFRKKSQKRSEKLNQKKKEAKRKKKTEISAQVSLGSLIGEDVFVDFLAPVSYMGDEDEQKSMESQPSERPSWYAGLPKRVGSETSQTTPKPSWFQESSQKKRAHSEESRSPRFGSDDNRNQSPRYLGDAKSPSTSYFDECPQMASPHSYPDAKSPDSGRLGSTPNSKSPAKGTPTTMATSPLSSSQDTTNSDSPKATRRERLQGGGSKKLSHYLSQRRQRHENGQEPSIQESGSKESSSETSLIGLSVAFPNDEPALDTPDVNPSGMVRGPQSTYFGKAVDSYVSEDSESKEEDQESESATKNDEQSDVIDAVPSNVFPTNTFSWKDASVLEAPSDDFHPRPQGTTTMKKPQKWSPQNSEEYWTSYEPPSSPFGELPENLYQAFGRKERESTKEASQHNPVFHTTMVIPGQEDTSEISSYHPIVRGVDIQENTQSGDNDSGEEPGRQGIPVASKSFDGKKETRRKNVLAKWWKGEEMDDSDFEGGGIRQTKSDSLVVRTKDQAKNAAVKWWNGVMPKIRDVAGKKRKSVEECSSSSGVLIQAESPDDSEWPQRLASSENGTSSRAWAKDNHDAAHNEVSDDASSLTDQESTTHATVSNGLAHETKQNKPSTFRFDESTAQAFSNIPAEFYGVLEQAKRKHEGNRALKTEDDEESFRDVLRGQQFMLANYDTALSTMKKKIADDPTLVQFKDQEDGQMLLHMFASSPFPPRVDCEDFLNLLLDDIQIFHEKLGVIFTAFPAACEVVNSDGDLPVHLLARNLMQWETTWYARVYDQASKESEKTVPGGPATAAITTLYHTMSRCVETLLSRVVKDTSLCQVRGSMGSLLPLHIATIFTASVSTLRQALESYPVGAVESAWIKGFDSFVPDGALAIEIHESFCTDFPKWEMEMSGRDETSWSQGRDTDTVDLVDSIRRSDLLFAYNPSIQRFWKDVARIRRIECRINFEAKQVAGSFRDELTKTAKLLWIWMCTTAGTESSQALFSKSVKTVVEDLPMSLVRILATTPAPNGEAVLDVAHPDCVAVIRKRLDQLSEEITPVAVKSASSGDTSSRVLRSWEEALSSKLSFTGKISLGQICRAIFNIKEKEIPTSFVILPYKLARNANGTLGMSSAESAAVAVKFADCLLKLTDPRSVLYYLDKKSKSYYGASMYEGARGSAARIKAFSDVVIFEKSLLDLYASRVAYLYLLDEETGIPLVPKSDEVYPMILNEPVSMVRKLLPMMVSGMIQMRSDKAVNVISKALLDDTISVVPTHYQHAAKKLSIFMYSTASSGAAGIEDSSYIKSELDRFLSTYPLKRQRDDDTLTGSTEWNVELSILRMLYEINDPKCTFSGLKTVDTPDGEIRWVFEESFEKDRPPTHIRTNSPIHSKDDNDSSSEDSQDSPEDSYTTFGADPLKFHQPPDDATETTCDTQATPPHASRSNLELVSTDSVDTTESERIVSRNRLFVDTFAVASESSPDMFSKESTKEQQSKSWSPAKQVRDDTRNRLDVTGFFWDEAQVTNLRVGLIEQADKLCTLQRRIEDIKQEESRLSIQVQELFCKIMGDNSSVLEVPSPRSLFGARKLLARLNELENRLMENEVDVQHFGMGVATLNEEIFDLVPLLEEELSSSGSSTSSSSSGNNSCASESQPDIQSYVSSDAESALDDSSSKIDSITSSKIVSITSEYGTSVQAVDSQPGSKASENSGAWSTTRSIERIRKAFAVARRDNPSLASSKNSIASPSVATNDSDKEHTKTSTLTDSFSSCLRAQAAAARSRATAAAQPPPARYPVEIDLPALDHRNNNNNNDSAGEVTDGPVSEEERDFMPDKYAVNQDPPSSSSSSSPMESSVVHYDKETGRIEF